jgi:hypothetical protein
LIPTVKRGRKKPLHLQGGGPHRWDDDTARKKMVGVNPPGTGNNTIMWKKFSAACPRPEFPPAITHLPHPYMHPACTPNASVTMILLYIGFRVI